MAGYLPEMQHLDVRPAIQAYELGQDRGNQDVQQNLLRRVGNTAATQGLDAASREAMAGGDLKTGVSLGNLSIERQASLYDFLGRAAMAADTPEKWTQLNSTLAKTFGPNSVKGFEDFKSRDSAIMLSMNASQQAQLSLKKRELDISEKRMAGEGTQPGWARKPDGSMAPIPGGPADPAYIKATADAKEKPRQMSITDITKLSEEGGKFADVSRFSTTFKDSYGGYGSQMVGNAAMTAGRNVPSLSSENAAEAAKWWQGYDRYKNVVRNELFGAALTVNEQAAFEKADINTGMSPATIRDNLAMQKQIVTNGLKRKANAMIDSGYDPKAIASAYGLDLKDIGVSADKRSASASTAKSEPKASAPTQAASETAAIPGPARPKDKAEYDALKSGTKYLDPNGVERTKQ
jgi:hypothetical protein